MIAVRGTELSLAHFQRAGGLKGAIGKHAEELFEEFPNEQVAIQRLFQRITERGDGEKPIRRPETMAVLSDVTGLTTQRLHEIVTAFVARGLLVERRLENGETEVDLPHECVAWKWDRLTRWIAEEAAAAKSLRFMHDSVAKRQWLTGSVLSEAQTFRAEGRLDGGWARRYLPNSEVRQVRNWTDESENREKSERLRLDRERRRAVTTAIVAMVVALIVCGLGIWAFSLKKSADIQTHNAQTALARSAVQDGIELLEYRSPPEPGQATGYFARALRSAPDSVAAISWLTDLLLRSTWWVPVMRFDHQGRVNSAAFSPDGRRVVTVSDDGTARVWEADTGKAVGAPLQHQNAVISAMFSPDGRRVVTASADRTARVWEADTGKAVGAPLQHQNAVISAAFSPDGRRVVTASVDGTARVWDVLLNCCESRREADRFASLAEIASGVEISDTGALGGIQGDRRQRMAELALSANPDAPRLSPDWLIRELSRWFRVSPGETERKDLAK